ncbi:MAG: acetyl-CoA carboxylase biotin carboxylase subunit [Luteitalea sp.]|nr:acetyl-CoA carboxylase biotin carboxylase subunit [Luteitalea sp.]
MIKRLLVANRGEIAVRIIRACRERGIETVAICSTADRSALHTRLADRVVEIGPAAATESYLAAPRIIEAARQVGADAIHPGYGFLSENAAFAAACQQTGIAFVGPAADVMARMGSKLAARRLMSAAGVPVVPGAEPDEQTDMGVRTAALAVGLPALIKASAGGGGRGMRIVRDEAEIDEAIAGARREATAAFGDGTLYVERLIERPRHVEVQIIADHHGHIVHLYERECSVQRRHQKILEETPSPALSSTLRSRIADAAVAAARAAAYRNAGTVEFIVEGTGDGARFYFLEMNTRLQVEHPITEAVTGIDVVGAQLAVAGGDILPWTQADIAPRGHAIECRVYAEDPAHEFVPQAGRLLLYREPSGLGIRVDSGVAEGDEVSAHYDPLLAKLVVWAEDRPRAIDRALAALAQYAVLGVRTNIGFLRRVLAHPRFRAGNVDTEMLDTERETLFTPPSRATLRAAVATAAFVGAVPAPPRSGVAAEASSGIDPWEALRSWRG